MRRYVFVLDRPVDNAISKYLLLTFMQQNIVDIDLDSTFQTEQPHSPAFDIDRPERQRREGNVK